MGERVGNLQKGSENRSHHKPFRINKPNSSVSRVSAVDKILHLQRTIGNRALTRLIQSGALQARLTVGPPNDIYEKEADWVADRVMRMAAPEAGCPECGEEAGLQRQVEKEEEEIQTSPLSGQITPLVQREEVESEEEEPLQTKLIQQQAAEEEEEPVQTRPIQRQVDFKEKEEIQTKLQRQAEEEEEPVQAKAAAGRTTPVTSDLESGIRSLKGGGQPLPRASRDFFEPRFGADFSRVRIHTGSSAARIARSINARAFTTGRDVVFGAGQYSPETPAGKKLLAHELTHVIQQNPGRLTKKPGKPSQPILSLKKNVEGRGTLQLEPLTIQRSGFSSTIEICRRYLRSRDFGVNKGKVKVTCNTYWDPSGCSKRTHFNITLVQKGWIFDSDLSSKKYPIGKSHSETWTGLESDTYFLRIWFATNTNPYCCLKGTIDVTT